MDTKITSDSCPETTTDSDNLTAGSSRNDISRVSGLGLVMQKPVDYIQSSTSLSSQDGSLYSQKSAISLTSSLFSQLSLQSERSIQSQTSVQSQLSLASQGSLQYELSQYSQSTVGNHRPSGCLLSDGKVKAGDDYRCITTMKGHTGPVSSVALVGELLYSGSSSNDIRVWFRESLAEYCRFGAGDGVVKALAVAGDRIFSAHQDHKIRVWKRSLDQQKPGHRLLATLPTVRDYLVSFIQPKNYVQIRRHKKGLCIEHVDTISVLVVNRSDNVLYSGSWDKSVKVWRLSDFKCLESFKAHDDAVNAIVLSEDMYVYTASADTKVKVWLKSTIPGEKKKKHALIATLESHKSAVNALALSSHGSILYSGASDRAIVVWEREDSAQHMTMVGTLQGHKHAVLCMATLDNILCSGSADNTIRVWKRESGTFHSCLAVLRGHSGPVRCIDISTRNTSKMGCMIYSGGADHDIKVWLISSCLSSQVDNTPKESKQNFSSGL